MFCLGAYTVCECPFGFAPSLLTQLNSLLQMCLVLAPHTWEQAYILGQIDIWPDKYLVNMLRTDYCMFSAHMPNSRTTLNTEVTARISVKIAIGEEFVHIMSSTFAKFSSCFDCKSKGTLAWCIFLKGPLSLRLTIHSSLLWNVFNKNT